MKPTPQAIENAAREHAKLRCQLSHSDVEFLPSDRLYAEAILRSDLGDMMLVPKEALQYIASNSGERTIRDMTRAMLSAAQGDADDQG